MDRQGRRHLGRELAGAVLLVALLLVGLLTSWHMGRTHDAISRELEDAAWYALTEDWDAARRACLLAEETWWSHRNLSAVVADHTPMEQIDALFARLSIYSAARESGEFAAACAELSRHMKAMGEAHSLSWWNLL